MVKVNRAIKKAQKQVLNAKNKQEIEIAERKLHDSQIDRSYIIHFPKGHKYLALHPTSGGDDLEMIAKRNEIRELIKEAIEKNDVDSLNRRFREETKMQIVKKLENNKKLKKSKLDVPEEAASKGCSTNKTINDEFFCSESDNVGEE